MELKVIGDSRELLHLAIIGSLDIEGVQAIEAQFLGYASKAKKPAIVDMSGVSYLTSVGIRLLLNGSRTLEAGGARMVLYDLQDLVKDILKTAGLSGAFHIAPDKERALELIGGK